MIRETITFNFENAEQQGRFHAILEGVEGVICFRSADEIERLRAALSGIVEAWDQCTRGTPPSDYDQSPAFLARRAQAALSNS